MYSEKEGMATESGQGPMSTLFMREYWWAQPGKLKDLFADVPAATDINMVLKSESTTVSSLIEVTTPFRLSPGGRESLVGSREGMLTYSVPSQLSSPRATSPAPALDMPRGTGLQKASSAG